MKKTFFVSICSALAAASAHAVLVDFTYTQNDTTGSGQISPFTFNGHNFTATPMPAAVVWNPNTGTPAGFVGTIDAQAGSANENNEAIGLLWSGSVTATATDGFTIQIPLVFVAEQNQTPTDLSDYTWNIAFGDSPANGVDAVSTNVPTGNPRFAMWFSRDTVVDAVETPNTFQRYTQLTHAFVAGQDSFTNNTTSANANAKDATDAAGAPLGTDAAGRDLAFYYGWRDQGALTSGAVLIDSFQVGGLLNADDLTLVPEPSSMLLCFAGASALLLRRRRR